MKITNHIFAIGEEKTKMKRRKQKIKEYAKNLFAKKKYVDYGKIYELKKRGIVVY